MPYYHVFIEIDGDEKEEHDLSKEELESLVESYHRNKKFMCSGSFVQPSEIDTIQIYETQENLETFLEGKRPLFKLLMPDDLILEKYAITVTKLFVKHPPRKRGPKKGLKRKRKTLKEARIPSKNIFIVHGRDHEPMKELKAMVSEFGLNPIVLHEKPSGSRTIVEKLEKYSDVGYAFVLLTPDDVGGSKHKFDRYLSKIDIRAIEDYRERARQNVILEFGYFIGKVGRDRVCCLYKGDVELPSDMHGIVYIPFKDSVEEARNMIIKELKEAGYKI